MNLHLYHNQIVRALKNKVQIVMECNFFVIDGNIWVKGELLILVRNDSLSHPGILLKYFLTRTDWKRMSLACSCI